MMQAMRSANRKRIIQGSGGWFGDALIIVPGPTCLVAVTVTRTAIVVLMKGVKFAPVGLSSLSSGAGCENNNGSDSMTARDHAIS